MEYPKYNFVCSLLQSHTCIENWSTVYHTHYMPTVHNDRLGMFCIQMLVSVLCTSITVMHSVPQHIATDSVATHHSTWHAHTDPQEYSDWATTCMWPFKYSNSVNKGYQSRTKTCYLPKWQDTFQSLGDCRGISQCKTFWQQSWMTLVHILCHFFNHVHILVHLLHCKCEQASCKTEMYIPGLYDVHSPSAFGSL